LSLLNLFVLLQLVCMAIQRNIHKIKNNMKKVFFIMTLFMSFMVAHVSAQDLYRYQSTENGLQIIFPGEADIDEDSGEGLTLEGEDYLFIAIPFSPEETTDDELTDAYAKIIASSKVDMESAEQKEFKSKTLAGAMYIGANEVSLSISGIVYSKIAPEKIGFIFHMMSTHDKIETAVQAVKSLEFYPEKIK